MATLVFPLPEPHTLKDKRRIRVSVTERLRRRFGVSVAEVGYQDRPGEMALALALVGSDRGVLESLMRRAVDFTVGQVGDASVIDLEFR